EEPDGVVRRVPARPRPDHDEAATGEPARLRLHRPRVGKQRREVGGLPPHRLAHDARHSTELAGRSGTSTGGSAPDAPPASGETRARPGRWKRGSRQSVGQVSSAPPARPLGRRKRTTRKVTASTRLAVPDGAVPTVPPNPSTSQRLKNVYTTVTT